MRNILRAALVGFLSLAPLCTAWPDSPPQAPLTSPHQLDDYASAGCQVDHLPDEFSRKNVKLTIPVGEWDRVFRVFIPKAYKPGVPTPLILSFHGHGKTAAEQQKLAGFSTDADPRYNPGWIVVTPQGQKEAWDGAPYAVTDNNDQEFIGAMLDSLEEKLCIDKSRIYAAGKSNGGGFVGKLACSHISARIAAFAPVSGAFYPAVSEPCNPARPLIPIIDFHGMADTVIPYVGGNNKKGFYLQPVPEVLRAWAARQGCPDPEDPTHIQKTDKYWRSSWSCGGLSKETIVAYNITGLKHAWPSTKPNDDSKVPTVLDATPLIIDFFSKWTIAGPADVGDRVKMTAVGQTEL